MSGSAPTAPAGSTTPPGSPPPLSPKPQPHAQAQAQRQPPAPTALAADDSAHKPLVQELSAILQSRPPVSNSKVNAITKYAIANRSDAAAQVADLIVDFIQRCPADFKLSGLYLVDSIIRADTASTPPPQNPFILHFKEKLPYATGAITQCPDKDKIKIKKVLDIWRDRSLFPGDFLAKAEDKWCRLTDPGAAATKASAPPKGMPPPQLRQPSGPSPMPQPQQQPAPPTAMPNATPASNPMAFLAALGGSGGVGSVPPALAAPPMFNIPGQQQQNQQQQAAPDLSNLLASLANTFGAAPPHSAPPAGMPGFLPAPPMLNLGGAAPPTLNLANMLPGPASLVSTPGGPGSAHSNPLASLLTQAMSNSTTSNNKPILPPGMEHDPAFKAIRRNNNDDDEGPADFKTARLKQSPEDAAECDRLLKTDWRITPVSRGGLTTWTQLEGNGVGMNEIRVLARTLFVSGITKDVSKSQLYELFGQHGTVESVMINYPKANAFIKLHTRSQATAAKQALDSYVLHFPHTSMAAPTTLRIRWGCGFGPKPKFDWDNGVQVVDFEQELDAFDKKFLMTSPAGGIREGVLRGGLTVEEPEVDTLEIKRWKLANPGVDLGVGTARFIGGGGGVGGDEERSYYKESEAGRGRGRGARGRGRGTRGGFGGRGRGRGGSDRSGDYDRYEDDDEYRRGPGGFDSGRDRERERERDRDYPSYGQGRPRSPVSGGNGGYDGGYQQQQQQVYGGASGGAGGYNGGYGAGGEQGLPPWLQQQQQPQGASGGYANGAPQQQQQQQQQPYGSPAYGGGQQQQGQGGYNGGYQGY